MAGDSGRSGSVYGGVTEPCTVVLFGASGDLAKRKVIPAMYDLAIHNALGPRYAIVGFARTPMSEDAFRTTLGDAAKSISEVGPIDPKRWDEFASNLYYTSGDYANPEAYAQFLVNRKFPEPTVLVMENFAAADKEPKGILANGAFNGERVGLEVAVKNSSRPDGQPTPWAYYVLTDPADLSKVKASASAFPDQACEGCHRQHASMDNVWVQFYPTLRKLIK